MVQVPTYETTTISFSQTAAPQIVRQHVVGGFISRQNATAQWAVNVTVTPDPADTPPTEDSANANNTRFYPPSAFATISEAEAEHFRLMQDADQFLIPGYVPPVP